MKPSTKIASSPVWQNSVFYCRQMAHDIPDVVELAGAKSVGTAGFLVYGPYIEIRTITKLTIELSYLTTNPKGYVAGRFDINLSREKQDGGVLFAKVAECELSTTNGKLKKTRLLLDTKGFIGYKVEFRVYVEKGCELNAFCFRTKTVNVVSPQLSQNFTNTKLKKLPERNTSLQVTNNAYQAIGRKIWILCKNLELFRNVWNHYKFSQWKNSTSKKNIFLRKFWLFFRLYPNIHMLHFYYERANSFMAPKIYEYVQMFHRVELNKNDVVLDLGCGDGALSLLIAKSVKKVIGVDILEHCIADAIFKAKELEGKIQAEFYCSKLEELDLQDTSIDKIVSFSVIEHIPNYQEVFEKVFSLLDDGGKLIVSVDSFSQFD
ncbi:MAG: methyltransferase domain-containing protein, partial [Spirochaetota bacterium]